MTGDTETTEKDDDDDQRLYYAAGAGIGLLIAMISSIFGGDDEESASLSFQPFVNDGAHGFAMRYDMLAPGYIAFDMTHERSGPDSRPEATLGLRWGWEF